MEKINKLIKLANLTVGQNVRQKSLLDLESLIPDITANGLNHNLVVWQPNPAIESYEIIEGHRRLDVIKAIEKRNTGAFVKWFGEGISCTVYEGITAAEALFYKVDHGNERPLTGAFEFQLCANLLFRAGLSPKAVCIRLAGLMELRSPIDRKSKNGQKMTGLESERDKALAEGRSVDVLLVQEKIIDLLANTIRRGMMQGVHNLFRCPDIVMSVVGVSYGEDPLPGYEDAPKMTISNTEIAGLYKAFEADLKILEKGVPVHSKSRPGPAFLEAWQKLISVNANKGENDVRDKAMSSATMKAEIVDGKFKSELATKLAFYHAGVKTAEEGLAALDKWSMAGDWVRAKNPVLWAMVLEEAAKIEKETLAADAAKVVEASKVEDAEVEAE